MAYTITSKIIRQRVYHFEFPCPDEVEVRDAFFAMPTPDEVQADLEDLIKQGYKISFTFDNVTVNGIAKATVTFSKEEEED